MTNQEVIDTLVDMVIIVTIFYKNSDFYTDKYKFLEANDDNRLCKNR